MIPLPRPSIDTGMGLERVAAILQGKLTNYETDLIFPIVERAGELCKSLMDVDEKNRYRAPHQRRSRPRHRVSGQRWVLPSNEGRGYVLRKIMRRAMRNARLIGKQEPYLYELTGFVAQHMSQAYPEMIESIQRVARIVKDEEHRYATTFLVAEKVFHDELGSLTGKFVPGSVSFKLYDTYGLALDEQEDMARERGFEIDREAFETEMKQQRDRARASWKGAEKAQSLPPIRNCCRKAVRNSWATVSSMPLRKWSVCSSNRNSCNRFPRMLTPSSCSIRRHSTPKPEAR